MREYFINVRRKDPRKTTEAFKYNICVLGVLTSVLKSGSAVVRHAVRHCCRRSAHSRVNLPILRRVFVQRGVQDEGVCRLGVVSCPIVCRHAAERWEPPRAARSSLHPGMCVCVPV